MENHESHNEASIEVGRTDDGVLASIKIEMPIWTKRAEDNTVRVGLPLFGLTTFADDRDDAEIAIKEAIICFCMCAEKFGHGLDTELKDLGWTPEQVNSHSSFSVESDSPFMEEMMRTGESRFFELDLQPA